MFNRFAAKRTGFLALSLLAGLITTLVGIVLWESLQTQSIQVVQNRIEDWRPVLTALRCFIIATLALYWRQLCHGLKRMGILSTFDATQLLMLRWRIVGWLVVIEGVLGQNLVNKSLLLLKGLIP